MWLVVGLGNPGSTYAETRHNVGFRVVEGMMRRAGVSSLQPGLGSRLATTSIEGRPVTFCLPQSYMNRSGGPVGDLAELFGVPAERVVVVHDDLDLPFGRVRCKSGGGHGGHNGLRDISRRIGRDFVRIRVGIGRPPEGLSVSDFVLGRWTPSERVLLSPTVDWAADVVESVLSVGVMVTMNLFNARSLPAVGHPQETDSSTSTEVGEFR